MLIVVVDSLDTWITVRFGAYSLVFGYFLSCFAATKSIEILSGVGTRRVPHTRTGAGTGEGKTLPRVWGWEWGRDFFSTTGTGQDSKIRRV